jgi:hypothetical protein
MKDFDITKLDEYYEQKVSFKCIDILKWCIANLYNEDFDISFAAHDIYNHYFADNSRKKPNNTAFYYIIYNEYSRSLYRMIRDVVVSPFNKSKGISSTEIQNLIKTSDFYINKIFSSKKAIKEDRDLVMETNKVYKRRLYTVLGKGFNIKYFYKYNNTQRNQIYSIHMDRLSDLKTIWETIKVCKEEKTRDRA